MERTATETVPELLPRINELLAGLGLGVLSAGAVVEFPGRNTNWAGVTDESRPVFVKYVEDPDCWRRMVALETADATVPRPGCHGWDELTRLAAFEWLPSATSGAELADDDLFGDDLAGRMGALVGNLHEVPASAVRLADRSVPALPPVDELESLSLPQFLAASAGELELWGLLHQDRPVASAILQLRQDLLAAPAVPIHGDLRLDQFVVNDSRLYLTDWEEFRLADAARDIGGFAGEWLFRTVMRIDRAGTGMNHDDVVGAAADLFDQVRSKIIAFWSAYRRIRDAAIDGELAIRATAFAGWYLFDRVLAAARNRARLLPVQRAALGIGRSALLTPEAFAAAVGLESTT